MDPLRSGIIFRMNDFSVLRSPQMLRTATKEQIKVTQKRHPVVLDEKYLMAKESFDIVYRSTPVPKALRQNFSAQLINLPNAAGKDSWTESGHHDKLHSDSAASNGAGGPTDFWIFPSQFQVTLFL